MQKKWPQYILISLLSVLVLLGLGWAIISGRTAAQSKQVLRDALAIQAGLEFFKQDQGRYPSTVEYADQNIMRLYLDQYPPQQFGNFLCQENYQYINTFPNSYEFRFCLPSRVSGYLAGWNVMTK